MPDWALISYVEPSHFDAGVCYVAATRYKLDDNKPYLFKTSDYGNSWTLITTGLPQGNYTRSVREDPEHKGLLYAGTETGIYVSFNDGANWQSLQLNLPNTPVHDIQIQKRDKALVIATHGRGFWILDDITPLYQINEKVAHSIAYLFKPSPSYRTPGFQIVDANMQSGTNAPNGVLVRYYLKDSVDKEIRLKFMTSQGDSIVTFSSKKDVKGQLVEPPKEYYFNKKTIPPTILKNEPGMQSLLWDMRYSDAKGDTSATFEGTLAGPKAIPGEYKVQLLIGDKIIQTQQFQIVLDPRNTASTFDLKEQFDLAMKIQAKQMEIYNTIKQLRSIQLQVNSFMTSFEDSTQALPYKSLAKYITDTATIIEGKIYNTKIKAGEDDLRFPVALGEKLSGLKAAVMSADAKPTASMFLSFNSLSDKIDVWLNAWKEIMRTKVAEFNQKASSVKKSAIDVK